VFAEDAETVKKQCASKSNTSGTATKALLAKMKSTPWADEWSKKRTMFCYSAASDELSVDDALEASLVNMLVHLGKPRRVLEVGMSVGLGAVSMLEGCPDAHAVSLEVDPFLKEWVSKCFSSFPQLAARHEVVVGEHLQSLKGLKADTFDMIFMDASDPNCTACVEVISERSLLAPGGVLVFTNSLANPAFADWLKSTEVLEQVVLPVADGISVVRVRQEQQAAGRTGPASAPAPVSTPARAPTLPSSGDIIQLRHASGASCDVSKFGANIISWCPSPGKEQLFMSSKAIVGTAGVPIRGGVPICWPQFGGFMGAAGAPGLKHGFARGSPKWRLLKRTDDSVSFVLNCDEETRSQWPKRWEFIYTVSLSTGSLKMQLEIENRSPSPIEFTGCLHTYWACGASDQCAVEGLQATKFDTGIGNIFRAERTEDRKAVPFADQELTELMYAGGSDAIVLTEGGKQRLRLTKSNMPDWVLWNVGGKQAGGVKDLGSGEHKKFICVEPAFASTPVRVAPGATWVAWHEAQAL